MKKYFVTGLVILLPLALTVAIIAFFVDLLTKPFTGIIQSIFAKYDLLDRGVFFLSADQLQIVVSKIIILFVLFFATVTLGIFARWVLFNYLIKLWDSILHRIPVIKSIYKTSQDVVRTIFSSGGRSFKQVVLVPFPSNTCLSVGLVSSDDIPVVRVNGEEKYISVFVPTTPNPTSGFVMLFKSEEVEYLDIKVEEALKFIISCGVLLPQFKTRAEFEKGVETL